MTDKNLKSTFDYLNDRFFNGDIPELGLKFKNIREDGRYGRGEIIINSDLKTHPDITMIILLHEMNHAYMDAMGNIGYEHDGGHNTAFYVGLDRLYRLGAYDDLL